MNSGKGELAKCEEVLIGWKELKECNSEIVEKACKEKNTENVPRNVYNDGFI